MKRAAGAPSIISWLKIAVTLISSLIFIWSPITTAFLLVDPMAKEDALGPPLNGIIYPGIVENVDMEVMITVPDNSFVFW